jgi:SAM-dependent methyltransferase
MHAALERLDTRAGSDRTVSGMINESIESRTEAFRGYYESPRTHLLDILGSHRPENVLEIGCGGGANLAELKRRFPSCRTTGVELRPDAADAAVAAGRVDDMKVGSILDEREIDFARGSFDLIVLSHVLEHFADPGAVLTRAGRWIRPGGRFLIALPNVRHLTVLRELILRGDFQYRPAGILDHTHLRFFTRKSALRFLAQQGLTVEAVAADVDDPKSRFVDAVTFGLARDFAAFAYNFLARQS